MDPQTVIDIGRQGVFTILLLGAPVLVVAAVVGIVVGLFQAVTQIHDQTILFVARIIAVGVVLAFSLPWLVEHYTQYSRETWEQIPRSITARSPY